MKLQYKSKNLNNLSFTDYEITKINIAGEYFFSKGIQFCKISRHIRILKENNVSFSRLELRLEKILKLGKDSSSRKSCFYRYGFKEGHKKFVKKKESSIITKEYYIEKYGQEAANKILSSKGAALKNYIARHGEEKGREQWEIYKTKRKSAYDKNKLNGYSYAKYNLEYYVKLHGEQKGTEVYRKKIDAQRYKVSRQRYIDEYGSEGSEICRKIKNNNSLESFIKRYGKYDGIEKYHSYCKKKRGPVIERIQKQYPDNWEEKYNEYLKNRFIPTKENFIKRYGEIKGIERFEEYLRKSANSYRRNSVSLISTELFDKVKLIIEDLEHYGKNELTILLTPEEREVYNRVYLKVDCEYNQKIIEFNGDAFHANPEFYDALDTPHPFLRDKLAKNIWQDDIDKRQILESQGYQVMYVWGSEYNQDKSGIIKKCIKFLTM